MAIFPCSIPPLRSATPGKIAKEVTDLAMQIHRGYGYSKEFPIERILRDSQGWLSVIL
ncbi:acyl-CoA dehydrogenase family protein [Desulfofundulus kuznetsovii]|uniref:acyl-CoA dehydrogenase family protein n=1 Tax=Desulfofundulus kuznetsovii TaxID=58135 RepID=UPI00338FF2F7